MSWFVNYSEESHNSVVTIDPLMIDEGDIVLYVAQTSSSYISGLPSGITVRPTVVGASNGEDETFFLGVEGTATEDVIVTGGPLISVLFVAGARFHQPGDNNIYKAYPTGNWNGVDTRLALCVLRPTEPVNEAFAVWGSDAGWNEDEFLERSTEPAISPSLFAWPHREPFDDHDNEDYIGIHGMSVALNPDTDPGPADAFTANTYSPFDGGSNPYPGTGIELLSTTVNSGPSPIGSRFQIAHSAQEGGLIRSARWTHYDAASFAFSCILSSYVPTYGVSSVENQGIGVGNLICVEPQLGARPMTYEDDVNPFGIDNPSGVPVLDKETCTLYTLGDIAPETC